MADKYQRMLWLANLRRYRKQLGQRSSVFNPTGNKVQKALEESVLDAERVLDGYYEKEDLSSEQLQQISGILDRLAENAREYIRVKREVDHYALDPQEKGVKRASGTERIRLEAAHKLMNESERMMSDIKKARQHLIEAANPQPDPGGIGAANPQHLHGGIGAPQHGNGAERLVNLEELKQEDKSVLEKRGIHADSVRLTKVLNAEMRNFSERLHSSAWNAERRKDLRKGFHLHRDSIMNFHGNDEFLENYEKYRLDIHKSVTCYRYLENLRDSKKPADREKFRTCLLGMALTEKSFTAMEDKINELEMIGCFMDTRAEILKNPAYQSMDKTAIEEIKEKSASDLRSEVQNSPGMNDDWKQLYLGLAQLKDISRYGIKPKGASTRNTASAYDNTVKNGGLTTRASFLTAYEDHGVKGEKNVKTWKGFKEYFLSRFKLKSSDSTSNTMNFRTGETTKTENAVGADAGANLFKGKLRAVKLGGKYKSKGEMFEIGAHLSLATVKTSADIGVSFSASKLWENKLYANASAEAFGLRGVAKASLNFKKIKTKVDAKLEGNIGAASASALGGVGMIRYKDEDGKDKEGFGVSAELNANAAVFKGSVSGGISFFGIRIGGKLTGQALAVGGSAKFTATKNGLSFGLGAALGLGAGFEISIDWSGAIERFRAWRTRQGERKALREKLRAEKAAEKAKLKAEMEAAKAEREKQKAAFGNSKKAIGRDGDAIKDSAILRNSMVHKEGMSHKEGNAHEENERNMIHRSHSIGNLEKNEFKLSL